MHPIEKLLSDYNCSLYALQKNGGPAQSLMSRHINNNNPIDNLTVGTICKMAKALDEKPEEILKKLLKYS